MRISDWSSDVCSSDLLGGARRILDLGRQLRAQDRRAHARRYQDRETEIQHRRLPAEETAAAYLDGGQRGELPRYSRNTAATARTGRSTGPHAGIPGLRRALRPDDQ